MSRERRRDRLIRERRHDPYQERGKRKEPAVCRECSALDRNGRWQWRTATFEAEPTLCPACQRIRDGYPAGRVTLAGAFLEAHRDEILALAHNVAQQQGAQHPLQRIMGIEEGEKEVTVTTTDMHLARAIGERIERAYGGDLDYRYASEASLLRVSWKR